jgi:ABC-type bacteriocin/lantibiotic exporter with double-glycine peptidase domain
LATAPVWAAWTVPLSGLICGVAWSRLRAPVWRRALVVTLLAATGLYAGTRNLWGATPFCVDVWKGGVCLQSSPASCSAAAAATLLTHHGLPANEPELAVLCLTHKTGTTFLGLIRGLRIKTAGTAWRVRPFTGSVDDLRRLKTPAILNVELPERAPDPRYERDWGWLPGVRHTVVFFGFDADGRVEMGDPSVGREFWDLEAITYLWTGDGVRLVNAAR